MSNRKPTSVVLPAVVVVVIVFMSVRWARDCTEPLALAAGLIFFAIEPLSLAVLLIFAIPLVLFVALGRRCRTEASTPEHEEIFTRGLSYWATVVSLGLFLAAPFLLLHACWNGVIPAKGVKWELTPPFTEIFFISWGCIFLSGLLVFFTFIDNPTHHRFALMFAAISSHFAISWWMHFLGGF